MEIRAEDRSKLLIVLILAALAVLLWLLSLLFAYTDFQSNRLADPLAELHSLSALYYAAVALAALSCVGCFVWRVGNRPIHLVVLAVLAAVLWLTPYLLAGFVRLPDGPWHVGAAMHVPEVLQGAPVMFSAYAWDFPGSFVHNYGLMEVVGIEPLSYLAAFPAVSLLVFVLLCHTLVARMFDSRVALLAMLIAIPGLHYLQLHASPHVIGSLLMLTVLLLLVVGRGATRALPVVAVLLIIIVIVVHPTTPVLLLIFLAAALVVGIVQSRRIGLAQAALAGLLVLVFAGWFSWYAYHPGSDWKTAENVRENVALGTFEAGVEFVTGSGFIYGGIFNLNKAIYIVYAAMGLSAGAVVAAKAFFQRTGIVRLISGLCGLSRSEAMLAVCVPPLLVLTFLLGGRSPDLFETGLTYLVLALSCLVASIAVRTRWTDGLPGRTGMVVLALFLAFTFPVVAYSIDAYSSFPKSEEVGLTFLAERGALNQKSTAGTGMNQLALYDQSLLLGGVFMYLNREAIIDAGEGTADLVVLRNTWYYRAAMRQDFSFGDNRYTRLRDLVEDSGYQKIYSSPTFKVYYDG